MSDDTSDQRDVAIGLMREQKFSQALPIFLRLIDYNLDDWSLYYMAGQCYRFTDNITEAITYLTKSSLLDPNQASTFLALGIARQLAGEYDLAIESLKQAISLDENYVPAYNSIGLTYRKLEQYKGALEWYRRAEEVLVNSVSDEVFQDKEYRHEEILEGKKSLVINPYALEKIRETLQAEPTYAILKNNMGICLMELGETDLARECFEESISFIPDGYNYTDPYSNLAALDD